MRHDVDEAIKGITGTRKDMIQPDAESMTWDEVQRQVLAEVALAEDHQSSLSEERRELWDRYRGEPLGNEVEGRSRYISRDILDKVEWIMPHLLNTFAMGDPKVEITIQGQPAWVGQLIVKRIQDDLADSEPSLYRLFYDWFKAALVAGDAVVKTGWNVEWDKTEAFFDAVDQSQMQQLLSDPQISIVGVEAEVMTPMGLVFRGVRARIVRQSEGQFYAENVPIWEFLWHPDAREMDDEHPKGQKTRVTLDYLRRVNRQYTTDPSQPFFWHLDEIASGAQPGLKSGASLVVTASGTPEAERSAYYQDQTIPTEVSSTETGARRMVDLMEWYTRLDIDGDGMLEPVTCWLADGKLIRCELNKDGFVPFSKCSPIREPHKFSGLSYAKLIVDLQNLKTMITRRTLDNFAFVNAGRWLVDPAGLVDVTRLLDSKPGDVIFGRPDAVIPLPVAPVPLRESLSLLEYSDSVLENRTGMTRYNQGTDANSLNKTATGVVRIQEAGMVRVHAIAALIAETGLRNFWTKAVWTYQQHLSRPIVGQINGQQVQLRPQDIQGKVRCKITLGPSAIAEAQQVAKLDKLTAYLMQLGQMWPGLVPPEGVHALVSRYLETMGFRDTTQLIAPLDKFMGFVQMAIQSKQQQAQAQQQAAQQQAQLEQQRLQVEDIKNLRSYAANLIALLAHAGDITAAVRAYTPISPEALVYGGKPVPNVVATSGGAVVPDLVAKMIGGGRNAQAGGVPGGVPPTGAGVGPPGRPNLGVPGHAALVGGGPPTAPVATGAMPARGQGPGPNLTAAGGAVGRPQAPPLS